MNTNKHKYFEEEESKKVRISEGRHIYLISKFLTFEPSHRLIILASICGYLFSNS